MSGKYGDDGDHWLIGKPHTHPGTRWDPGLVIPDGSPWVVFHPCVSALDSDEHRWFATWVQACDYVRAQCPLRVPHFPSFAPPAGFYEGLGQ